MTTVEGAGGLIAAVRERVLAQLPEQERETGSEFVAQLLRWVPIEDLSERTPENLAGAAISQLNLLRRRAEHETRAQVLNPSAEQDGWTSPHSVIQLVSDDMPFLVDSVTIEMSRQGFPIDLLIHPVMRVERDRDGFLLRLLAPGEPSTGARAESVMHVEVGRTRDPVRLQRLQEGLLRVLAEVRAAVADWQSMRLQAIAQGEALAAGGPVATGSGTSGNGRDVGRSELHEAQRFLAWLAEDHFTFLGYREYELVQAGGATRLLPREGSGLGLLRAPSRRERPPLTPRAVALAHAPEPLVLTKANSRSTVHRPAYLDYVGVKQYGGDGRVNGEARFLGLYTTSAYRSAATEIPLVRQKVATVLDRAGFPPDSHDAKALRDIIESYPRDALLQISPDDLFHVTTGILGLGERPRLRLFVTADPLERFLDCLVCIPRDRFNTENRERMEEILCRRLGGRQVDWSVQISESLLARVQYIVRGDTLPAPGEVDEVAIERELASATRAWSDELHAALVLAHGEERGGELQRCYGEAFPAGYRSDWDPGEAIADIDRLERLEGGRRPIVELYRPRNAPAGVLRCKLLSAREIALSDVLPTFEHMGADVVDERPHRISPAHGRAMWIYDFGLRRVEGDLESVRDTFHEVFLAVLAGELEDDALGELVLRAGLDGRRINLLRAVGRYLRQAGLPFSDAYTQRTLVAHAGVARLLVELFEARLHPTRRDAGAAERLLGGIGERIEAVASLDEDRILRAFLAVVRATLRTNFFRVPVPDRVALKLDPDQIELLPRPRPQFEVWVYSPRVEGVHLRGGKVARGGLRWSDRPEDFRTEILGLMKAQMVKNALIVPVGSKGGFVVKRPPDGGDRDALRREAIECYRTFLGGLLELTDNIVAGEVKPPEGVVRIDGDDPYLVVAADKGTASFSDIANEVSERAGFWLGDAFASGGSHGYDHKAMGITARGAWESVKRHFRELGRDIQSEPFTVVGIGDMSGDVFGNGMLLSPHTRLLAAFNHMHVFIDPDPDPDRSARERRRLFELERSTWADYDESILSDGGGVYPRTAKHIELSPQARMALGIETEGPLSPNQLISRILCAPVDLLWNGGIGTYVKASDESHADAGDKANDALRVNGSQLRCKLVGEGGNLGFTQRGRIEYAIGGGRINTDAIDNVAGVNTSDHEVNIKILLDALVAGGELTRSGRNALLAEMTEAVAERVLYASYTQTQALSLAVTQAASMVDVHAREIRQLEQTAGLDRQLEGLPEEEEIAARRAEGRGLVSPELAVLLARAKIRLHAELLESDVPDDVYLLRELERYFPSPIPGRYGEAMSAHRLRREIIATTVANGVVDRGGSTFAFRLCDELSMDPGALARAYTAARDVLAMLEFWREVESLDNHVSASVQTEMLMEGRRLLERSTRWLARSLPDRFEIESTVARFREGARAMAAALPDVLEPADRELYDHHEAMLLEAGVPRPLAAQVAAMTWKPSLFDIVTVSEDTGRRVVEVIEVYFRLGGSLELNWLGDRINELPRGDRWQTLARAALREDLLGVHRELASEVLQSAPAGQAVASWEQANASRVERWQAIVGEIKGTRTYDTVTLPVALRAARGLLKGA